MSNEKSHKIDAIKYFVPLPEGDYDFQEHLTDYLLTDILNANKQLEKYEVRVKELEEKLNAQFTEMEEKLTSEENKNFELKEENKRLKGWREISHKKIDELSQRVKNYIKCTNALTCEINDLKEENQNLKEQIKELQYQIEHNKRIRDFGNKQMVKKIKENKLLKQKLQIAEEALNNIHFFDCDTCKNLKFKCDDKCDDKVDKIVEQALQKIKEI